VPVLPAEVEQRISFAHDYIFYFGNKDCVVAGILNTVQTALEIGHRAVQNRGAMSGAIEACPGLLFRVLVSRRGTRVILGDCPLVFGQNVHPETFFGMEMAVRARPMIHADQDEEGIE